MANVYDAVTREEALRHRFHCDGRSAEIISQLVQWLDKADAATSQRTINDLTLRIGGLEAQLTQSRQRVTELTEELWRIKEGL